MTKLLVITGASRGIGLATARTYQNGGYRVINLSRQAIPLPGAVHITADLQDPSGVDRIADTLLAAVGQASAVVLIHNAARQDFDRVSDLDGADFSAVLQLNLVAPQQLNRLLIPLMPTGSAILYLGSTLAEKAVAGFASYVASKHGLIGLMRATVQDLAEQGIHSACICPGFTDTEMLRENIGHGTEIEAAITAMVSQKRLIAPQEIADTLWFCGQNPVINGSVIHANLGQLER